MSLTLGNFHLRDGLPLVHSHEPGHALTAAAEVNDKLASIIVQSFEDFLESLWRETARWKEKGCNYDLLLTSQYTAKQEEKKNE
jgi:hypothetical protein